MSPLPSRRFQKVYEQVLLSRGLALTLGWLVSVALPTVLYWGPQVFWRPNSGQQVALITTSLAFLLMHFFIQRTILRFPGGRSFGLIITQAFIVYALVIVTVLLLRIGVSRMLLVSSGFLALLWFHLEYLLTRSYFKPKLAIIPGGRADDILLIKQADKRVLETLDLNDIRYDGVVADFQTTNPATERFLTECALAGVAVYNASTVYETLTGRVKIHRMTENNIGSLLPSANYVLLKTLFDWLIVLASLPVTVPLMGFITLLIRLESPGPAIYRQIRIGKGNKPFTIYKFRSMFINQKQNDAQFASQDDPRITKVGRVLRILRLDELPQFLNILKGEMSLIGPRPEQPDFVEAFNKKIPFYSYRHVIKPGITGWAQVCMGYAADTDATQTKVEYDFYYIKNCSLALDFFIVLLTAKTMLTGFGAR